MIQRINEKATKLIEMLEDEKTDVLLNEHSYGRYAYDVAKKFLEQDAEIEHLRTEIMRIQSKADAAEEDRMALTAETFVQDLRLKDAKTEIERLRGEWCEIDDLTPCDQFAHELIQKTNDNKTLIAEVERLLGFLCDECGGSGYSGVIVGRACPKCHGTGRPNLGRSEY